MDYRAPITATPEQETRMVRVMARRNPRLAPFHNGQEITDRAGLLQTLKTTEGGKARRILGTSTKVEKGRKYSIETAVLYLAAGSLSGLNLCPDASPGCLSNCLKFGFHLGMEMQTRAQLEKTYWLVLFPGDFLRQLEREIERFETRARKKGMQPALRLNGTSDVRWEVTGIMQRFPGVQFYDYTKIPLSDRETVRNYHLTYSVSELPGSLERGKEYARNGHSFAVVVGDKERTQKGTREMQRQILESGEFEGFPAVDGNQTDARMLDPKGSAVVLRAIAGAATKDKTGFVRRF